MPGLARHQPVAPRRNARSQASRRNGCGVNGTSVRNSATRDNPPMLVCARYDILRAVAEASGVEQITLWALPKKRYQVSFRIKNQAQEWYLATLRNTSTPRAFVNLGAAAHIAYGIAHAPIMIVNMSKAQPK
ncbi:MAG: hypothetical protein MRJ68_18650 [Nitrospira sp.]|nr:hypothetical protein [Nitrospira sp.]